MMNTEQTCAVCDRDAVCMACGVPLCSKHRSQWYRHHAFNDDTIYVPNEYVLCDDHAEIVIRDKKCEEICRAIIDLDDVEKCRPYKWHRRKGNYIIATIPNGTRVGNDKMHLHRLIAGYYGSDLNIDHINRNPLDNRKCNLRITNMQTNATNKSQSGVIRVPSGRYQAHVTRHYKPIYIGTYDTYDEAVEARRRFVENYDANDSTRISIPVA